MCPATTCAGQALCRPSMAPRRPALRRFSVRASAHPQPSGSADPQPAPASAAVAGARCTAEASTKPSRRAALAAVVAGVASVKAGAAVADEKSPREGEIRHSDAEWRELLTPEQYAVLRRAATEKRYSSPLVEEKRTGTFCCAGCGSPLFASTTKYESGTGWPSFFDVLPSSVSLEKDTSIPFMPRVEVRCRKCQGHLGHVFADGPQPTGLRYCMNGLAMVFKPLDA